MILISAPVHQYLIDSFIEKGKEVLYVPDISYDDLKEEIKTAEGLVVTTRLNIDKSLLNDATKLKWIGRLGSGLELIDIDYAQEKNIVCLSTPEGNCTAVGEHALGLLLSLFHKIHVSANEVGNNIWKRNENRGTELTGKTIGIIGFGNTGSAFARVLSGFNVRILVYDKYKAGFASGNIEEADIKTISEQADVISFHLPLTDETYHIANDAFFSGLAKKPIILNTSRGPVVDTAALINALNNGNISGAGLDVLENEKIKTLSDEEQPHFDFLKSNPWVIITPHIAGYSHEAYLRMSQILLEKLKTASLF